MPLERSGASRPRNLESRVLDCWRSESLRPTMRIHRMRRQPGSPRLSLVPKAEDQLWQEPPQMSADNRVATLRPSFCGFRDRAVAKGQKERQPRIRARISSLSLLLPSVSCNMRQDGLSKNPRTLALAAIAFVVGSTQTSRDCHGRRREILGPFDRPPQVSRQQSRTLNVFATN